MRYFSAFHYLLTLFQSSSISLNFISGFISTLTISSFLQSLYSHQIAHYFPRSFSVTVCLSSLFLPSAISLRSLGNNTISQSNCSLIISPFPLYHRELVLTNHSVSQQPRQRPLPLPSLLWLVWYVPQGDKPD